jgi:membrane associated rhomboid family serine protease
VAASSKTVACANCGALNGEDFDRCIRCGRKLRGAEPADKALRRVPAPRRRAHAPAVGGPGAEPLLGRWPVEVLPAAKLILFLNMVVFAGHLLSAFAADPSFSTLLTAGDNFDALRFGALPLVRIVLPGLDGLIVRAEPWRILSACYVHFGPIHLGMNMMALIYLARYAEPAIGSVRFIIAYTLCGIGGYATSTLLFIFFNQQSVTAGASGAIFGLVGLMVGYHLRRRDPQWKAWSLRTVIFLAIPIVLPMSINHSAHVGGVITGILVGAAFGRGAPKPSRTWHRVLASLCILASLGALLAVRLSPYYAAIDAAR